MHDGKGAVERREPLVHSSLPIIPTAFSFCPLLILHTTQRTPLGKVVTLSDWLRHFRVPPDLCIKTRLSAQLLIWKWFFIAMQIKLIFTNVHLTSFWKWGVLELGGRWPVHMTVKMTFADSDCLTENQTGAELSLRGGGGGWGFPPPSYYEDDLGYLYEKQKELPNCLFPRLPIVFTQQLEILMLTLSATNCYSYLKEYKKIL